MGELLEALLTLKGYKVTHARSGKEALEVVQAGAKLDVILCDIHMPGLRGNDLAATLAAERDRGTLAAGTLLLGMSGSAPKSDEARPFDAFLHKPFTVEDLEATIKHATTQSPRINQPETSAHPSPLNLRTFTQLQSQLGDTPLRQLYQMTLADVRMRLKTMAESAQQGDHTSVRREAHAIKGGCGMVGATELQELAAATEGGSTLDTSALADFAAACQRLQRMLDERF
jgi:CheY-like chemotaxis protein